MGVTLIDRVGRIEIPIEVLVEACFHAIVYISAVSLRLNGL